MERSDILTVSHLKKNFGSLSVIDDLSFTVRENSVYGFLGKNGAGKTTTMKMILGLVKPSAGEIYVCGEKVKFGETRTNRFIGYLPDVPEYYGYMKPKEYLRLCGEITGLKGNEITKRSNELLELVGLTDANRRIKGFSRGMKQRLGIAQALLNEPKLLLCDEPTSALDPIGRKEILDIISVVKERTTVIFSTHILSDVERVCDSIAVLEKGRICLEGELSIIKERHSKHGVRIVFAEGTSLETMKQELLKFPFVLGVEQQANELIVQMQEYEKYGLQVLQYFVSRGIIMRKFEVMEPTLESLFVEVVG